MRGASGRIVMTFKYTDIPDFSAFMDVPQTRKRKWGEGEEGENVTASGAPGTPNTPNGPPTPTTPTTPSSIPTPSFSTPSSVAPSPSSTPSLLSPGGINVMNEDEDADEDDEGKEEMAPNEVQRGDVPGTFGNAN